MFIIIIICKIIVTVLYSVEKILCDYVSVTSTNYEVLGRGGKSYHVCG